jgi:acetate kinase
MSEVKTPEELVKFLQEEVGLFKGFPVQRLREIIDESVLRTFEGNEAIIEYGQQGLHLGVLTSGCAHVSVTVSAGEHVEVATLKPGDVIGEISLLTGDKTVADVIANTRCFLLLIPQEVVSRLILTEPKAVMHLSKLLADRMREITEDVARTRLRNRQADGEVSANACALPLYTESRGKLLALNFGLSRSEFGVFDTHDAALDIEGVVMHEHGHASIRVVAGGKTFQIERNQFSVQDFFQALFELMQQLDDRYLFTPFDVIAVGHRVVHGGSRFTSAEVIVPEVLEGIEALSTFAPLHQPINLEGIRMAMDLMPDIPHVAVFDTAFHHTLPTYAYLYGLPYDWYKKEGIRRYGFHGTTHRYVSLKSAEVTARPLGELEIVSCYLGAGASLCAVDHGRSVDTTMGMTPSDGLMMCTRSGSVDPSILIHLMRHYDMTPEALSTLINSESGLRGLSGIDGDIHHIEAAAEEGHHRALLAHKAFCYQVRKSIGGYVAAMGGIDVLAFTGGIGEHSALVRSLACQGLGYMGIRLDEHKNSAPDLSQGYAVISADDSPVKILIIVNDDQRLLAWEALRAIERNKIKLAIREQGSTPIPIEISAHHVHLSQTDVDRLFGLGHQLTPVQELSQPGQFACAEKVNLIGPKGKISNVRVLGPTRKETQVEIAMTEQFKLGITTPIRESGDLAGTPGVTLEGKIGSASIDRGVICAQRHIHMSPEDAMKFGVRDKYIVKVRIPGERELIFGDVVVRVNPNYRLAMHIDTDEGNAANITTGMEGFIEDIQSRA